MNHINTGCSAMDKLIGGYEKDVITTIYGPSGSGKTNICVFAIASVAKSGKKVLFMDTEGGFSIERIKQIADNHQDILDNIIFFKPTSFTEQKNAFDRLRDIADEKVGLIVIDSIAMLYRLELGKTDDIYTINRSLGQQISYLTEIARKKNIPTIITNQVYANFDDKTRLNMVGGDILKYGSKCLVELSLNEVTRKRKAILRKHRHLPENLEVKFKIEEKNIKEEE